MLLCWAHTTWGASHPAKAWILLLLNHHAPALDQKANGKAFGNFQLILAGNEWLTKEKNFLPIPLQSKVKQSSHCREAFHHLTNNGPGIRLLTPSLFLFRKADLKASGKSTSLNVSSYRSKEPSPLSSAILQQPPVLTCSGPLSCTVVAFQALAICALVVKDSFPYFRMVWSLHKTRLIFPKHVRIFSLPATCSNPTPSMCRALTPSITPPLHKYYFTRSPALQIAQSSGICHLSVKAISSKLRYL